MKEKSVLNKLYMRLNNDLTLKRKLKSSDKTILETLLNIKSTERYKILDSISIEKNFENDSDINKLVNLNHLRMTDHLNKYTLTAFGIWDYESKIMGKTNDTILEIIDKKYFDTFGKNIPLNDREIVVLFLLITLRSFSKKSFIHLKINDSLLNNLQELIESCYEILLEMKEVNTSDIGIFGKKGNEHPVSNLLRHTDQLPKKTKGIYSTLGNDQKYYLNLYNEDENNFNNFELNLKFIISLIFKNEFDSNQYKILINFLSNKYNSYFFLFYDPVIHIFKEPRFAEAIEKILFMHKQLE